MRKLLFICRFGGWSTNGNSLNNPFFDPLLFDQIFPDERILQDNLRRLFQA
jgi:hypothetical protein